MIRTQKKEEKKSKHLKLLYSLRRIYLLSSNYILSKNKIYILSKNKKIITIFHLKTVIFTVNVVKFTVYCIGVPCQHNAAYLFLNSVKVSREEGFHIDLDDYLMGLLQLASELVWILFFR